ncbi:MAG TPA: DUF4912 domain-containing protein [Vicinamibacteria bacterium]|nr:DUF4912 domain-containing protein [Vicinamibacteria bacterium]
MPPEVSGSIKPAAKVKTGRVGKPAVKPTPKPRPARTETQKKGPAPARKVAPRPRARVAKPAAREPELAQNPLLSEEEQIEAAKYLPRELPARLFEEERFIFPSSYGVTRLRLLVKDPYWLFAHWDVAPEVWSGLRRELGERAAALSRLTLRVADAQNGGGPVILLPEGARSWYIRADAFPRSYRAELGLTLPSGEFRRLAVSNLAATPRVGPSTQRPLQRRRWDDAKRTQGTAAAATAPTSRGVGSAAPWAAEGWDAGATPSGWTTPSDGPVAPLPVQGGASDAFRR